jgi:hypothetical protein
MERILGHIEVETKNFTSKARQRKDRYIVYNPDMGEGTSDNRCNECFNFKGVWGKSGLGVCLNLP